MISAFNLKLQVIFQDTFIQIPSYLVLLLNLLFKKTLFGYTIKTIQNRSHVSRRLKSLAASTDKPGNCVSFLGETKTTAIKRKKRKERSKNRRLKFREGEENGVVGNRIGNCLFLRAQTNLQARFQDSASPRQP